MRPCEEGALHQFIGSHVIVSALIHEVAMLGENPHQPLLTCRPDEEHSLQDGSETYLFLPFLVLVGLPCQREIDVGYRIRILLTQQVDGRLLHENICLDNKPHTETLDWKGE